MTLLKIAADGTLVEIEESKDCMDCRYFCFDPDVDEIGNRLNTGEVLCLRRPAMDDHPEFPIGTRCGWFKAKETYPQPTYLERRQLT